MIIIKLRKKLVIINYLISYSYNIKAYDPQANKEHVNNCLKEEIQIFDTHTEIFNDSDLCLILTEWPEFKQYDYIKLSTKMRSKNILDTRNILDIKKLKNSNIKIYQRGK